MKVLIAEMSEDNIITVESTEKAKNFLKNCGKIFFGKILKNFLLKRFNLNNKDIEEIKSFFNGLDTSELEDYKNNKKLLEEFKDTLSKEESPKIIIIDELDRCRPDYAIQLLEIIKHIFDVKNIIFLFLINREQLESIVSTIYMNSNLSNKYFEKFYDVELNLPKANYEELNEPEFKIVNDFKEYKVDKNGYSNNRDLVIQKIFLDIAFVIKSSSWLENNDISIRNIKKLLKKFNILKDSLIEEEKEQYILILALITYFFIKELNLKASRNNRKIIVVIIEKYLKKIDTNNTITDIILEALQNNNIQNQNVDIYTDNSKYFNKNENYCGTSYKINIFGKNIYFNNFKSPLCRNFNSILYLSVNIEETTLSLWLEKKYNFIK
nr:P-loop NTPase fold protein [uncultured Fusobacterium sp.]